MEKKGTVTQLSSIYPAEETQKASRRVQDAIAEREQQLNQLKAFIDDNTSIMNLVQKLPDETHHNIMVPFGKAAFFPGRLIHTNELTVLLGEGYYAERTSKQTAEILKRRGKALEAQVESLKAIMQDLKAEASFFDVTADESAEGLVEIREDYVEEASGTLPAAGHTKSENTPFVEVGDKKGAYEDEEYIRLLARMAELEKEEEEAAKGDVSNENEQIQNEPNSTSGQITTDEEVGSLSVEASEMPAVSKEVSSHGDYPALNNSMMNTSLEQPREKKEVQAPPTANKTAFTGSIVERAHDIRTNMPEQQIGTRSSKPVSRFKMQRK
ncbi:hypothetical protein ABFS82_13G008100 [Erythranthe guttata]|uniref:RNA polymerase II subunit 5-mediating protein homolog n=1 Tax=Erythranthe guttata TaxID=4155 RepID=A0A022RSR7_ERYGU|nr:PREDICTED: RNA polymerase II subunit 5-mediating protein homolog [Erythranthe guttata]EYU42818.1 hypothetical protein MIMGU_mgv1a009983mg [Erythranthe guttata]|eukprot:XP_012830772.1 PREDICTED: RNA polymerase II subunit 5-mediating protein homolog [Erythranthe guttata]